MTSDLSASGAACTFRPPWVTPAGLAQLYCTELAVGVQLWRLGLGWVGVGGLELEVGGLGECQERRPPESQGLALEGKGGGRWVRVMEIHLWLACRPVYVIRVVPTLSFAQNTSL